MNELRNWGRSELESLFSRLPEHAFTMRSLRQEVDILLSHATGLGRAELLVASDVSSEASKRFQAFIKRRKALEPVSYIVGSTEFYGLEFITTPGVLIPRPETEILVDEALKHTHLPVFDLCCGSGNIGISIAKNSDVSELTFVDLSQVAINCTRQNAEAHNVSASFVKTDAAEFLKTISSPALVVCNPPYVALGEELPEDVELFEPGLALFGGNKGTEFIWNLLDAASTSLKQDSILLVEMGCSQVQDCVNYMVSLGFNEPCILFDLENKPRAVFGKL